MLLNKSNSEHYRELFLIDTDLQLLNAIHFILSHHQKGKMDAIIQMRSRNADERISRLKEVGIFDKVYCIPLDKHSRYERFEILIALLFPRKYIKKKYNLDIWGIYNSIYMSFATKAFDFLIAASGCNNVIGYDDGMASYVGDPFTDNYKKRYLIVRKLLKRDYCVDTIYLNNPACYNGDRKKKIKNLQSDEEYDGKELINYIFSFQTPDDLENQRNIFLNMPITDVPGYIEHEKELAEIMKDITKGDSIVRLHPSEKREDIYNSLKLDKTNNMWELICRHYITDNSLLVSCFSTAQFSPKLLNDTEPYLVFTFMMFDDLSEFKQQQFQEYVSFFKTKYEDCSKIYLPKTIDEYKTAIQSIIGK